MFTRTRSVFFLMPSGLRAATGIVGTGEIKKSSTLPVEEGLSDSLQRSLREHSSRARFIVPEEYLYLTQVEIPMADAVRPRLVKSIGTVFPEALSDLAWDFEVVAERDGRAVVEVSGVTKDFGALLAEALASSGIHLEAVIPESYALARALPSDEAVLLVHEREAGTILCLAEKRRVISSIVLDHQPSEAERSEFIAFGQARKQFVPKKMLLSGVKTGSGEISSSELSVISLETPLDPIRGALLLDLSSQEDTERLDLPLRAGQSPWYRRLFHH